MQEVDIPFYEMTHTGPLSAIGVTTTTAFLQTVFQHENGVPDIQVLFMAASQKDFI